MARYFDRLGLTTIPADPATKKAKVAWKPYQTRRPSTEELEAWHKDGQASVALLTGEAAGLVVVDIDSPAALEWAKKNLPPTKLKTLTSEKAPDFRGQHWFYRHPGGKLRNRARIKTEQGKLAIDVRADGGYVIAPGSAHPSGCRYERVGEWTRETLDGLPVFDPAWLAAPEPKPAVRSITTPTNLDAYERASRWLAKREPAVEGSGGDAHTFTTCCEVLDFGLTEAEALDVLRPWNATCLPPWTESGLAEKVNNAAKYRANTGAPKLAAGKLVALPGGRQGEKQAPREREAERQDGEPSASRSASRSNSAAGRLLNVAAEHDLELFHDSEGTGFATVPVGGHFETMPIKSQAFGGWLRREAYRAGIVASNSAMGDAVAVMDAQALYDGLCRQVAIRVGGDLKGVYIDLGDEAWTVVEVDAEGWRIAQGCPVRFWRSAGTEALPAPERDGCLRELLEFTNLDEESLPLLAAWLVGAFHPSGPYPILQPAGEQGSGKSSISRMAVALTDPNTAPLRRPPREERGLMVHGRNRRTLAYDNLSYLQPWFSDALCSLATGGGFGERALHTNSEEVIFQATRPILLNGITLDTRADLAERSLVLRLAALDPKARQAESRLWSRFREARGRLFGAILTAVSAAIRNLDRVQLKTRPRMADFAEWVTAAEEALPWPVGTFEQVYASNREESVEATLEADSVAQVARRLVADFGYWEGTASDFIAAAQPTDKHFPGPRGVGKRLRRAATFLRQVGVEVEHVRSGRAGERMIRLSRLGGSPEEFDLAEAVGEVLK